MDDGFHRGELRIDPEHDEHEEKRGGKQPRQRHQRQRGRVHHETQLWPTCDDLVDGHASFERQMAQDGEDGEASHERSERVDGGELQGEREEGLLGLEVRAEGDEDAPARGEREHDLDCGVQPHPGVQEPGEVGREVELEAWEGPRERQAADEEDEDHEVGQGDGDEGDLRGALDAAEEGEEDEEEAGGDAEEDGEVEGAQGVDGGGEVDDLGVEVGGIAGPRDRGVEP